MNFTILKIELLHCVLAITAGAILTLIGLILVRMHRTNTATDDVNWYHDKSLQLVIGGISIMLLGIAGLRFWAEAK